MKIDIPSCRIMLQLSTLTASYCKIHRTLVNIAALKGNVPSILRHISHFFCLFLVLQVFVLTVHADDMGDDDEFVIEQGVTVIHQQAQDNAFEEVCAQKQRKQEQAFPEHRHNKRYQTGKHISVQIYVAKTADFKFTSFYKAIVHTPAVAKDYRYIYFREINPPPPKAC